MVGDNCVIEGEHATFYVKSRLARIGPQLLCTAWASDMYGIGADILKSPLIKLKIDKKAGWVMGLYKADTFSMAFFMHESLICLPSGALLVVGLRRIQRLVKARVRARKAQRALAVAMAGVERLADSAVCGLAQLPADVLGTIARRVLAT